MSKRLVVLAGPNGSGKSSIMEVLSKKAGFPELYISPDEHVKIPRFAEIEDERERYIAAMEECEQMREYALELGESLAFETVFSGPDKLRFLLRAKRLGYKIEMVYVSTETPYINITRVLSRVSQGGHSVPIDKIFKRYEKSMSYLPEIHKIADDLFVYDNSLDKPRLSFIKRYGDSFVIDQEFPVRWVDRYLVKRLKIEGLLLRVSREDLEDYMKGTWIV